MPDYRTDIHEADEATNAFINQVVAALMQMNKGVDEVQNRAFRMSAAISIVTQVFLAQGGNPDGAEEIGEMVKLGVITAIKAYKDMNRVTHKPKGRVN